MAIIVFATLWIWLIKPISDGDIWFHILYGRYLVEHKTLIPDHTIYSWTPSTNTEIYCAWIGHILYYLLYKWADFFGIIAFRYFVISSLFMAILWFSWKRNIFYHPIIWLCAIISIVPLAPASYDKPEALSFIFITLLILNWYVIKSSADDAVWKYTYFFPLLMLIWVNSHGGFIFGCIFLLCIGIGEFFNQLIYRRNALSVFVFKHLCIALFLSIIAIFITPYGYNYIFKLFLSVSDVKLTKDFSSVMAYIATFDASGWGKAFFANGAIALILFTFMPAVFKKRLDFVPVLTNIAFAFIFTLYLRSMYFWPPVFCLSIVYILSLHDPFKDRRIKLITTVAAFLAVCYLSGVILYKHQCYPPKDGGKGFDLSEMFCIDDEIEFIKENLSGKVLGNVYDHGSYILWRLWPGWKVMIDARYFPYRDWYQQYIEFERGRKVEDFIEKYPFDCIEIKHASIKLSEWFYKSKDWQLAFYSKGAAIYVKKSLGYNAPVKTGKGLDDIKSYGIAMDVLNFTFLIKDWQNAERALATMERNFTCSKLVDTTAGFRYLLNAFRAYYDRNYFLAVELIDKAAQKEVKHSGKHSSALVMKAIDEWRGGDYLAALKDTIKANQTFPNFIASYNMAVMAWRLERLNPDFVSEMQLNETEAKLVSQSRQMFENIVKNEYKTSPQYLFFVDDARDILNGQADDKELIFIKPEDV